MSLEEIETVAKVLARMEDPKAISRVLQALRDAILAEVYAGRVRPD